MEYSRMVREGAMFNELWNIQGSRRRMGQDDIYRILPYAGMWRVLDRAVIRKGVIWSEPDHRRNRGTSRGHFDDIEVIPGNLMNEAAGQSAVLHAIVMQERKGERSYPLLVRSTAECSLPVVGEPYISATLTSTKTRKRNHFHTYGTRVFLRNGSEAMVGEVEICITSGRVLRRIIRGARERCGGK